MGALDQSASRSFCPASLSVRVQRGTRTSRIKFIVWFSDSSNARKNNVPIEPVLCDREFDSMRVFQMLWNLDVNYLIPKWITSSGWGVIEQMEEDDQEVAVEPTSIHVEAGSHSMHFLYCRRRAVREQPSFQRISRSGQTRPRLSVGGIVAMADRERVQVHQRRFPRKDLREGLVDD